MEHNGALPPGGILGLTADATALAVDKPEINRAVAMSIVHARDIQSPIEEVG
jgi:hypothetical protein